MKYSNYIGIAAAALLIISCFLPWAYYPDIDKTFTGFYSQHNVYGKPGKFLAFLAIVAIAFFLLPKVWAKRANLLLAALLIAFSVKTFILFSSCYQGTCPEKKVGIFLMLIAPVIVAMAAILPRGNTEN